MGTAENVVPGAIVGTTAGFVVLRLRGRIEQIETIPVVEVAAHQNATPVAVPGRSHVIVYTGFTMIVPDLGEVAGLRVGQKQMPVNGVIRLPVDQ